MASNTVLHAKEQTLEERKDPALEQSLCSNCAMLEGCTLRREGTVVHFCEEFVVEPGPVQRAFPREVQAASPVDSAEGLCATCDHREECVLRLSAEGGVWYCEEYE